MAISDPDLVYWLGVLFSARKRGDACLLDEALRALRQRGVTISFIAEQSPNGNEANAAGSTGEDDG